MTLSWTVCWFCLMRDLSLWTVEERKQNKDWKFFCDCLKKEKCDFIASRQELQLFLFIVVSLNHSTFSFPTMSGMFREWPFNNKNEIEFWSILNWALSRCAREAKVSQPTIVTCSNTMCSVKQTRHSDFVHVIVLIQAAFGRVLKSQVELGWCSFNPLWHCWLSTIQWHLTEGSSSPSLSSLLGGQS